MAAERWVMASVQFLVSIAALPFSASVVADIVVVCVLVIGGGIEECGTSGDKKV